MSYPLKKSDLLMISVWWAEAHFVSLDQLSDHERAAVSAMRRDKDRRLRATAYALRRRALAAFTGQQPDSLSFSAYCASCGGTDHGAPRLNREGGAPVFFSVSHSGSVAGIAIGGGVAVGIDVEAEIASATWSELRDSVLHPCDDLATLSPTACWTAKEAALKQTGFGLAIPMNRLSVMRSGPTSGVVDIYDLRADGRHYIEWITQGQYTVAVASTTQLPVEFLRMAFRG